MLGNGHVLVLLLLLLVCHRKIGEKIQVSRQQRKVPVCVESAGVFQGQTGLHLRPARLQRGNGVHGTHPIQVGSPRLFLVGGSHVLHALHHALPTRGTLPRTRIGRTVTHSAAKG